MIYIDPRQGSGELLEPIKARVNGQAQLCQMEGGDFAFEGNGPNGVVSIGIERKMIGDMLSSMRSGRYAGDQLVKMGSLFDVVYLIVEGLYRPSTDGMLETFSHGTWQDLNLATKDQKSHGAHRVFLYAELDKFLSSLEIQKNVIVLRSTRTVETVWQIVNRYNWWQREWDEHHSTEAIKLQAEVTLFKCSLLRKVASELPGIGWHRSKVVDQHFLTVEKMVCADANEWASLDGIGATTANRVWKALRNR